jgi:hypothetical protein
VTELAGRLWSSRVFADLVTMMTNPIVAIVIDGLNHANP